MNGNAGQKLNKGFTTYKASLTKSLQSVADSFIIVNDTRKSGLKPTPPVTDLAAVFKKARMIADSAKNWYSPFVVAPAKKVININCSNAQQINDALANNRDAVVKINLTADSYLFSSPLNIYGDVVLTTMNKKPIRITSDGATSDYFIQIAAGHSLTINNLNLDLRSLTAARFITTDTAGGSGHSNFIITGSEVSDFTGTFYHAAKSTVSDSVVVRSTTFKNNKGILFNFSDETDRKGYYNVEKLRISNNNINNQKGQILTMLRGGNDESTMGPDVLFSNNQISNSTADKALINLTGTQKSLLQKNSFTDCNKSTELVRYEDFVRAAHLLQNNSFTRSGTIVQNKFLVMKNNLVSNVGSR